VSEKRIIATGAVVRCAHCNGSGKMVSTRTLREEMCLRCLGHGNIVRFEAYERERV
jgi:DnaJ-class molecular chaperone